MTIYIPSRTPQEVKIGGKYDLVIVDRGGIRYTPEQLKELGKTLYDTGSGSNAMKEDRRKQFAERIANNLRRRTDLFPILDVGCGLGDTIEEYMKKDIPCVGLDIDMEQLEIADCRMKERGINPILVNCDADRLPFEDNSFGGITDYGRLMMIPLVRRILEGRILSEDEIRKEVVDTLSDEKRVLRYGGEIHIITAGEKDGEKEGIRVPYKGVKVAFYEPKPEEFKELVMKAGLEPLYMGYHSKWSKYIDARLKKSLRKI